MQIGSAEALFPRNPTAKKWGQVGKRLRYLPENTVEVVLFYDMGHGQYLVYISKSSIFEECIIVFQVLGI